MKTTFAQLGIPFPLFDGPARDASDYEREAECILCGINAPHCFRLGIGSDLIVTCTGCGIASGLDAYARRDSRCKQCGINISFPPNDSAEGLYVCYKCLRDGKAALTKDTEIGMVRWEDAVAGITHGRPGLRRTDLELTAADNEGWIRAKVPCALLTELTRTPSYTTCQGEQWLFCCGRPMVFLGSWNAADFTRNAQDNNGATLFEQIVEDPQPRMWENGIAGGLCVYAFRCTQCQRLRANWDMD